MRNAKLGHYVLGHFLYLKEEMRLEAKTTGLYSSQVLALAQSTFHL